MSDEFLEIARLQAKVCLQTERNAKLVAAIEDAIETLEAMDLHIDNPLYERLCKALGK